MKKIRYKKIQYKYRVKDNEVLIYNFEGQQKFPIVVFTLDKSKVLINSIREAIDYYIEVGNNYNMA